MTRTQSVLLGLVCGAAVGVLILAFAWWSMGGGDADGSGAEAEPGPETPAEEGAPGSGGADRAGPMVRMQPVTVYQRAATADVTLVGVPAQIVWMDSPVERARQIVRIALEGTGEPDVEAYPPTLSPVSYRDVLIDDRGIAWVDLEASAPLRIGGSDEEQALVAVLARSLVEGLDEVRRVGLLIDGEPRRTLSGHVDIGRTFSGSEWPLARERYGPPAPPAAGGRPAAASGSAGTRGAGE